MRVESKVTAVFHESTITDYLAARFTYLPHREWLALVEAGKVWCNGEPATEATTVRAGNRVACELPDFNPPDVNYDYSIVHADDWLLGINKPGNLRVHSRGIFTTANLIHHLRYKHQPPYPEASLINRLDADTSGVVLAARDKETQRAVAQQFSERQVDKEYLAVVQGIPVREEGTISLPIGPVREGKVRHRQAVYTDGRGKTAVSHYRLQEKLGPDHALLLLHPETGRTHQLRVHLAAIDHPIVGDALYTMDDRQFLDWCEHRVPTPAMQGIARQALHCRQTSFIHPIAQQPCTIAASLPSDMRALIARLRARV